MSNHEDENTGTATAVLDLPDGMLPLPERTSQVSNIPRKVTYHAGRENVTTIMLDGEERQTAVSFDSARLIKLSVRPQEARQRMMLVLTTGIILDGLDVSLIEPDGTRIKHPLLSDPRFANYLSYPHRLNAQQWMDTKNVDKVVDIANFLQSNRRFRIDKSPQNPQNSQRKTRDLFTVRPIDPLDPENLRKFGTQIDAFEVSVNPDYEQGFSSFWEGLTEQQDRWVSAATEKDAKLRAQRLEGLRNNLHFIGGTYHDEATSTWWARPVDVGSISIGDTQFPFYPIQGDKLDINELMNEINQTESPQTPTEVALEGPTAQDLSDF